MTSGFPLTPGAERSLERATQLAVLAGANQVAATHMLWALWLEEGHAAAVLGALGVSKDRIELDVKAPTEAALVTVEANDMAREILYEARQFAGRYRDHSAELTSEHLLLALTRTAPVLLTELGITEELIADRVFPQHDTSALPVAAEYQLGENTPPAERTPTAGSSNPPAVQRPTPSVVADDSIRIFRTIDAAANRVREGLRVVEDYVRFGLNDRILTSELKNCRHDLATVLDRLDANAMIRSRDTRGDTGTTISTATEHQRESLQAVVLANMKRVQEALRTLEEFLKLVPVDGVASGVIEQIRYRTYTIEKAIAATVSSNYVFAGRGLYLLVTEAICRRPWKDVVIEALAGGVGVVQLREKTMPDAEIVNRGRWLRAETHKTGALFIMNDRPDLAVATEADGVHIGQEEMSVAAARQVAGPSALIGVSTHNLSQARAAILDGADYLGVGPVFPTTTKDFDDYAGLDYVTEVIAETSLPWFAIGGINETTVNSLAEVGVNRIAVSSAICGTESPAAASELMARSLKN